MQGQWTVVLHTIKKHLLSEWKKNGTKSHWPPQSSGNLTLIDFEKQIHHFYDNASSEMSRGDDEPIFPQNRRKRSTGNT